MIHYIDTEIELDDSDDYRDVSVIVEFDYTPAEPEVAYYRNGDPGHSGTGEAISILHVMDDNGRDYINDLSPIQIEKLTDFISNYKADY